MSGWKVVAASVRGPSHEKTGDPCQDAFFHESEDGRLIAAVADGAGSARFSDRGAKLVTETLVSRLRLLRDQPLLVDGEVSESWRNAVEAAIGGARDGVSAMIPFVTPEVPAFPPDEPQAHQLQADDADDGIGAGGPERAPEVSLADYHATLLGVVAGPEGGFFYHIGDGAGAAVTAEEDWAGCAVSKPENGEYANETYFFTMESWREHLRFTPFAPAATILMVSDGAMGFTFAERLAGVEGRFMAPVSNFLAANDAETGTRALAATLDREDARRISDDDKTVLWARLSPGDS